MSDDSLRIPREITDWLASAASTADDFIDIRWRRLRKLIGSDDRARIQPYIGFGTQNSVSLQGRVLTNPQAEKPEEADGWWENLLATYQRFESDEVVGAQVTAVIGEVAESVLTDSEGYYHFEIERQAPQPTSSLSHAGLWSSAALYLNPQGQAAYEQTLTTCDIQTPLPTSEFAVISDIDDTILHTAANHLLTVAKLTFLGNSRTRVALPGVASFYQALQAGNRRLGANPIFYVSSSPWNLYDLLEDFIALNDIPRGTILLRDFGFDEGKLIASSHDHKLKKVRRLMQSYPDLRFVLIGDSGQEDAKLYANAASEFQDRIAGIFIRDVSPGQADRYESDVIASVRKSKQCGVPMHLIENSYQAAEICVSLGFFSASKLADIKAATHVDENRRR